MNLIQRGTTASRANRGKSVIISVAQGRVHHGYGSHLLAASSSSE